MATIGLSEAARLTGKPRSTIHRAMASGRLSYTLSADGARLIDPAELERVWPGNPQRNTGASDAWDNPQHAAYRPASGEIRELRARLADKDAVIDDLRRRLDVATEQLGEAMSQVRQLTDQRSPAVPDSPPATAPAARRRRFWPFGR